MFTVARRIALSLIVALLFVPAAARAQQHLQPTGGAALTTFSTGADDTREKIAGVVVFTAAIDTTPTRPVESVHIARAVGAVPTPLSDQTPPDALRAPPAP